MSAEESDANSANTKPLAGDGVCALTLQRVGRSLAAAPGERCYGWTTPRQTRDGSRAPLRTNAGRHLGRFVTSVTRERSSTRRRNKRLANNAAGLLSLC